MRMMAAGCHICGLVGLNVGLVLRNVQARLLELLEQEEPQYARIASDDADFHAELDLLKPESGRSLQEEAGSTTPAFPNR